MSNKCIKEYTLNFEKKDSYLYVFVFGPKDSFEIAKCYFEEIYNKVKELEYKAVLIEEDFPNQISTMDMYDIGKFIAEKFIGIKIAHVDKQMSDLELNKFGETVAMNRGVFGRIFNNVSDAEKWLIQD